MERVIGLRLEWVGEDDHDCVIKEVNKPLINSQLPHMNASVDNDVRCPSHINIHKFPRNLN